MADGFFDDGAEFIADKLISAGYEAYLVGGCVRDALSGKTPADYDIASSAPPDEVVALFGEKNVVKTGIKHGTVTVLYKGKGYETTTFRTESGYSDCRRPDGVEFVGNIEEDLKRRDFTVNAMAYSKKTGLIDLYGGLNDLKNGVLRAVGEPRERFEEDALRILRALRFSSKLGFKIEENTARAARDMKDRLRFISGERLFSETTGILLGKDAVKVLLSYPEIIFAVIPELKRCYKFDQHSKWHSYDVYEHIVRSVGEVEGGAVEKWTMLLHDIGKPDKFFIKNGEGHFYGHAARSEESAKEILKRFKPTDAFKTKVLTLIKLHDYPLPPNAYKIKKVLNKIGEENFKSLLKVKYADNAAQGTALAAAERKNLTAAEEEFSRVIKSGECYSLKTLAVNGGDMKALGYEGERIGEILEKLLDGVMSGEVKNGKESLIKEAIKRL